MHNIFFILIIFVSQSIGDYNINIIKIKYILSIVGLNKNDIKDARYIHKKYFKKPSNLFLSLKNKIYKTLY
jgi:hypothetical protein